VIAQANILAVSKGKAREWWKEAKSLRYWAFQALAVGDERLADMLLAMSDALAERAIQVATLVWKRGQG
jgi:hypothetical protein